jgi:hypothetical protein
MCCFCGSVFCIEEGGESVSDVAQKLMEFFFGVEFVSLVEGGIIVAHVFPDLLIEVVPHRRNHVDCATHQRQNLQGFSHLNY